MLEARRDEFRRWYLRPLPSSRMFRMRFGIAPGFRGWLSNLVRFEGTHSQPVVSASRAVHGVTGRKRCAAFHLRCPTSRTKIPAGRCAPCLLSPSSFLRARPVICLPCVKDTSSAKLLSKAKSDWDLVLGGRLSWICTARCTERAPGGGRPGLEFWLCA